MTTAPERSRVLRLVLIGLAIVILVVLPFALPSFLIYVVTRILIFGLFASGFNLVFGYGGMHSLGHAAFFGAGVYVAGMGATEWHLSGPLLLVLALVVGGTLGVVFGLLCSRFRGIYLLLLTLALAELLYAIVYSSASVTGGDNGIANVTAASLPEDGRDYYLVTLCLVVLVMLFLRRFMLSPLGMSIAALRESPSRTASSGFNTLAVYAVSFGVSGAICGLAGGLNAFLTNSASPDTVSWLTSAAVMVYAIVGGSRYFFGPFLGAAVLIILEIVISPLWNQWVTVLGVIYIVVALFLPEGILGRVAELRRWWRHRKNNAPMDPRGPSDDLQPASDPMATGSMAAQIVRR